MLLELVVENYAVVERLRVHFHAGLNLLTGETGSGKSIVVDALGLLLGGRASAETIRTGESRARVAGIFDVREAGAVRRLLEPAGLDQHICDALLGASVPGQFKDTSASLAVDWTDLESFSRPPPRGTSDCADPEASWGHRKDNLLRSQDELAAPRYRRAGTTRSALRPSADRATGLGDPARRHPRRLRLRAPRRRCLGTAAPPGRGAARPRTCTRKQRRQGHPPRRHHRQREPVLPVHPPHPDRTRAAGPHRHQRAGRGPRPQDR